MKPLIAVATLSLLLAHSPGHAADMTWTFAVRLNASVQTDPPRIELRWLDDPFVITGYTVQRKAPGARIWEEAVALPGSVTQFVDENVQAGQTYEYQIIKHGTGYVGHGYIAVGVGAPLVEQRGRALLVVDDHLRDPLAAELLRFEHDLAGDGWTVVRLDVSRDAAPADVRARIAAEYWLDPARTEAVILLGRIPIVRSGLLNVDSHGARPMPADVFYGDIDGVWTDANGDGIYDQNTLPSDVELQIGRIDFADLPGRFSPVPYPDEIELTRRYLNKNHAFRHAVVRPRVRALIGDGIGDAERQAYSASAYRNFATLVGNDAVFVANTDYGAPAAERWITRLTADDYLWAFAGGSGSDWSIGAVGTHPPYSDVWASDFLQLGAKGTFYMVFGSWLGDWSKSDNIMRSILAAPEYGLTASWSGRPHHFYHHMGVGATVGEGIRLSQNNDGFYRNQVQRQLRGIHVALLGDPTLRQHQLAPPRDLTLRRDGSQVQLAWTASPDNVIGYHVYRGADYRGPFQRITTVPVAETHFADPAPEASQGHYHVRAVARHVGPSGNFFHSSQAAGGALEGTATVPPPPPPAAPPPAPTQDGSDVGPAEVVWVDDALPAGADGHVHLDRWNWVTSDPTPFSGTHAHQSELAAGLHHHFFTGATPLHVGQGDTLFAYVYLDPANPPRQVMLTWLADDHWEHRAFWGENLVIEGVDGGPGRRRLGPLPPTGQWVRLEVPASAVDMENRTAVGMGFTLVDGRATWDRAGVARR